MATLKNTKVHFLKLVDNSASDQRELPIVQDTRTGEQRALFAAHGHRIVIFVNASAIGDVELRHVVEASTQGTILDIRVAPRFDIGSLNRGKTFELFESHGVGYTDYCGVVGIRAPDDDRLFPSAIGSFMRSSRSGSKDAARPLSILLDSYQLSDEFITKFMDSFADEQSDWDVLVVPQSRSAPEAKDARQRRLVFISHAAPEDNDFSAWLAARLRLAGYEPWLDLSDLRSGDTFWPAIEGAIKDQAAVVLVVMSQTSKSRVGVLNEVHLASTLERTRGERAFILPLKVDGISNVDVPIQLQRRQYIDFSRGWAEGLRRLVNELGRNGIARKTEVADCLSAWIDRSLSLRSRIGSQSEELVSNWLPIVRMPSELFLHAPPAGLTIGELARRHGDVDPVVVDGRWFTFVPLTEENCSTTGLFPARQTLRYATETWVGAERVEPPCGKRSVRRSRLVDLLRRATDRQFQSCGMRSFQLSGRRRAWFFEHEALNSDRVNWIDAAGKSRRKNLVGFSPKKSVFWHLAIELKPSLWPTPCVVVKLHVIFSVNGRQPLGDAAKMHALRRRFCKSWWNENWRDLMLAALFHLSKGRECLFDVNLQSVDAIGIGRNPLPITVPFSVISGDAVEDGAIDDLEDQLADDEDWTNEDFESPASTLE